MADKDFKVKSGLDLGTPLPLTEGGTGQTSASNALNALLPVQTDNTSKVLQTNGTSTSWVALPNGFTKGNTASRPGSPSAGDIYSNTETGYIEVYTSAGWSQLGVIPLSATIGTATDVGTNRTYNNGAVSVTFTPAVGGGLASSFTATSTAGGYSASGSSSPIVVTDIPVGTSATFTVTATNGYGNALATAASNSATATTLPQTPTIGTATATTGIAYGSTPTASLTFTAGATGGKTISNYKYSTDNITYTALSPEDATSPITIPGLTAGTSYTFRVKAVNANGDSVATSASNSILAATVPQTPTVGTAEVTNGTTVSIPFTAGETGGSAITSYTVTASPSVGDISTSGTTSPLTVTGTFSASTPYTFTVKATNAYGTSSDSLSSNSVVPNPAYALSQTFTTSGNFTVPAGKTKIAVWAVGAGSTGSDGDGRTDQQRSGAGGKGGGGGGTGAFKDYVTSPGTVFAVVVGTSSNTGGVSTFGNLLNANGGNNTGNVGNYGGNAVNLTGSAGGVGGNGGNRTNTYSQNGGAGGAGTSGTSVTQALAALGSVSYSSGSGGGGGGGGGSYISSDYRSGGGGGSGGSGAGNGGAGGQGINDWNGASRGSAGGAASNYGSSGGGGGGAGSAPNNVLPGGGGNGSNGVVYVYVQ